MQEISSGLQAIADAMHSNGTILSQAVKEDICSTLEGQAQVQVLEEICLISTGKLVMLDILADAANARTYLVLRSADMSTEWIRLQLWSYEEMHIGVIYD